MFEDSLFASTARPNPRRGWAAAISFMIQAVVLGTFVLVPLMYTDALPVSVLKSVFVVTAPTRPPAPKAPEVQHTKPASSNMQDGQVIAPIRIPPSVAVISDSHQVEQGQYNGPEIPGAIPGGTDPRANQITRLLNLGAQPVAPHVAPAIRGPYRLSHMDEGLLIHRVTPVYPKIAIMARQQGAVVLQATIGRDGTIQNLRYVNGPNLLIRPAMDAVQQWRYRPYILNNEPVEVETQITVNFVLGQ